MSRRHKKSSKSSGRGAISSKKPRSLSEQILEEYDASCPGGRKSPADASSDTKTNVDLVNDTAGNKSTSSTPTTTTSTTSTLANPQASTLANPPTDTPSYPSANPQASTSTNTNNSAMPAGYESIDNLVNKGIELYKEAKELYANRKFMQLNEKMKMAHFKNTPHQTFIDEYPIVAKYAILMGKFNPKAFRRYLERLISIPQPPHGSGGNKRENWWFERHADYVRFLWESYQGKNYDREKAKIVWQDAYKSLKKEIDDFRDTHKEVKQQVEEDKKKHHVENVKELLERIASGTQTLDPLNTVDLKHRLKAILQAKRSRRTMESITSNVNHIPATVERSGTLEVANVAAPSKPADDAPTIKMIEYVTEEAYERIPASLHLDPKNDPHMKMLADAQ